ncbi:zinc-binding alcohol dehydrogenase family protein [Arenicella sp. 4NH20-0111]|uniref:zinc-binding alcohol dehydrogenase family protein n=1 Tax=Arenicella sp. 4NH20-0111 TaxID=3127648 RepID=UPI0031077176
MKAIGYKQSLPIDNEDALIDVNIPKPSANGHDLLVKVAAVGVNPVDYKVRQTRSSEENELNILGWDAVGEVVAIGELVEHYAIGDNVFYAGDITRSGSNAEYQLVDERIVGVKPTNLSNADAAALPLTAITAWELLFEHLSIDQQSPADIEKSDDVLLVVGAAGGVGSILLQLAATLTGATIIATASRASSQAWVKELGAHHVVNHREPLTPQIQALGLKPLTHIASLNNTESYFDTYIELLEPFGKIGLIDDPSVLDVAKIKPKSLSLHWEFMFARSMHAASHMGEQRVLLNRLSKLLDQGYLKTTAGKNLGLINAQNLRRAHKELESRTSIGKLVLEGF